MHAQRVGVDEPELAKVRGILAVFVEACHHVVEQLDAGRLIELAGCAQLLTWRQVVHHRQDAVSQRRRLDLSPATIRSVMAELEERGLLSQPHVSAGRLPTPKAWRLYVDSMIGKPSRSSSTRFKWLFAR